LKSISGKIHSCFCRTHRAGGAGIPLGRQLRAGVVVLDTLFLMFSLMTVVPKILPWQFFDMSKSDNIYLAMVQMSVYVLIGLFVVWRLERIRNAWGFYLISFALFGVWFYAVGLWDMVIGRQG